MSNVFVTQAVLTVMKILYSVPVLFLEDKLMEKTTFENICKEAKALHASKVKLSISYIETIKEENIYYIEQIIKQYNIETIIIENEQE